MRSARRCPASDDTRCFLLPHADASAQMGRAQYTATEACSIRSLAPEIMKLLTSKCWSVIQGKCSVYGPVESFLGSGIARRLLTTEHCSHPNANRSSNGSSNRGFHSINSSDSCAKYSSGRIGDDSNRTGSLRHARGAAHSATG